MNTAVNFLEELCALRTMRPMPEPEIRAARHTDISPSSVPAKNAQERSVVQHANDFLKPRMTITET